MVSGSVSHTDTQAQAIRAQLERLTLASRGFIDPAGSQALDALDALLAEVVRLQQRARDAEALVPLLTDLRSLVVELERKPLVTPVDPSRRDWAREQLAAIDAAVAVLAAGGTTDEANP